MHIIRKTAVQLISDNFGETTARMYSEFYADKDGDTIIISVKEMLVELLGEKKAQEKLAPLYKGDDLELN